MSVQTRAKFVVAEVKKTVSNAYVTLEARYDPEINKEDHLFMTATPGGKLEMSIYPVSKGDFFKPGEAYYLDFTKVEPNA